MQPLSKLYQLFVILAVCALFFAYNVYRLNQASDLLNNGKTTVGTVVRTWPSGRRSSAKLDYQFSDGRNTWYGFENINDAERATLPAGKQISVTYLPSNPDTNARDPNRVARNARLGEYGSIAVFFLGVVFVAVRVIRFRY